MQRSKHTNKLVHVMRGYKSRALWEAHTRYINAFSFICSQNAEMLVQKQIMYAVTMELEVVYLLQCNFFNGGRNQ